MNKTLFKLSLSLILLLSTAPSVSAATYYVSKKGNNSNGLSWSTAWSELGNIAWSSVKPGDIVMLDGGPVACEYPVKLTTSPNSPAPYDCGMVYETVLNVNSIGTSTSPVTIKLSTESGRNGTARIFGGRGSVIPQCGASASAPRSYGLNLQNADYVTVDGSHWGGIMIYGFSDYGIGLANSNCLSDSSLPTNITVRNVEVYDNGSRGIRPGGTNLLFDRILVHDNGQDSFQVDSKTKNFTIRQSWLFNSRPSPSDPSDSFFSACTHSDGVQIYAGGSHSGFTVENSIVGPGHMHTFMLGDINTSNSCIGVTTVNDVLIKNTILVGDHGPHNEDNLHTKANSGVLQNNYIFDRVTSVRDPGQAIVNNSIKYGSGREIKNSIFYGGVDLIINSPTVSYNNYCYQINDRNNVCANDSLNPNFKDLTYNGLRGENGDLNLFADFDFTITNSVMSGVGASIHSVSDLFGAPLPTSQPTSTRAPTVSPTRTPSPTLTPSPTGTSTPSPTALPSIPSGVYWQTININLNSGENRSFTFSIPKTGNYLVRTLVQAETTGENSYLSAIDHSPVSPEEIWDITDLTSGFEERIMSHRGSGSESLNEFDPKIFPLSSGNHTITFTGREYGTIVSQFKLEEIIKPGDANNDTVIDGIDYTVWLSHYNPGVRQSGGASIADFNNDGYVDDADYVIWLNNYGK